MMDFDDDDQDDGLQPPVVYEEVGGVPIVGVPAGTVDDPGTAVREWNIVESLEALYASPARGDAEPGPTAHDDGQDAHKTR
jgi:hypothetical protein